MLQPSDEVDLRTRVFRWASVHSLPHEHELRAHVHVVRRALWFTSTKPAEERIFDVRFGLLVRGIGDIECIKGTSLCSPLGHLLGTSVGDVVPAGCALGEAGDEMADGLPNKGEAEGRELRPWYRAIPHAHQVAANALCVCLPHLQSRQSFRNASCSLLTGWVGATRTSESHTTAAVFSWVPALAPASSAPSSPSVQSHSPCRWEAPSFRRRRSERDSRRSRWPASGRAAGG
eukprot:scaffold19209_cov28-Tisochrysis_lutea.AAC.1